MCAHVTAPDSVSGSASSSAQYHLNAIRRNRVRQLLLRIENGWHCIQIKKLLGHGHWIPYILDGSVGYASLRTIERDMALADALYEYRAELHSADHLSSASALSLLASADSAEGEMSAVDTALALMKRGVRVTTADAQKLALVNDVLPAYNEKIAAGEISIQSAAAVSRALQEAGDDPAVKDLVQHNTITSPDVVTMLVFMKRDYRDQFQEICQSGTLYNPLLEQPIPIASASVSDLQLALNYADVEREARRQEHIRAWRAAAPTPIFDIVGEKAVILKSLEALDDTSAYRIVVYADGKKNDKE